MRLLIATPSPFARKARVALLEKRIACEVSVDNPWNSGAKASRHNPLGKIPVLFTDDGKTVFDSKVIVEYLEAAHPAPPLFPAHPMDRVAAKQIEVLGDGVCDAMVLVVLERVRKSGLQSRDWVARQIAKIEAGVAQSARALGAREWFIGGEFGVADIAVGCMLGYLDLRLPGFDWRTAHPGLAQFFERIMARDSFRQTMPTAQAIDAVN